MRRVFGRVYAVYSTPIDGCLRAEEADGRSAFPGVAVAVAPLPGVAAQEGPGAAASARRGLVEARAVINHIGMSELKFSVTLQRFMTPTV